MNTEEKKITEEEKEKVRVSMFTVDEADLYRASKILTPHLTDIMANLKALVSVDKSLDEMDLKEVLENDPARVKAMYDFFSSLVRFASYHGKTMVEVATVAKIKMLPAEDIDKCELDRLRKIQQEKGFCFDVTIEGEKDDRIEKET